MGIAVEEREYEFFINEKTQGIIFAKSEIGALDKVKEEYGVDWANIRLLRESLQVDNMDETDYFI